LSLVPCGERAIPGLRGVGVGLGVAWDGGQTRVATCPKARLSTREGGPPTRRWFLPPRLGAASATRRPLLSRASPPPAGGILSAWYAGAVAFPVVGKAGGVWYAWFACASQTRQLSKPEKPPKTVPGMDDCLPPRR